MRQKLARRLYDELGGIIRHGPFIGMKISNDPSWGRGDKGCMLLGIYEKPILELLTTMSATRRTFVDVGAADGYYAVGLVYAGLFDNSICFEMSERGRSVISDVALENGVKNKIAVFGTATSENIKFALSDTDASQCVFLFDIEGGEFSLISENLLYELREAIIVVELHEHMIYNGVNELRSLMERAAKWHDVRIVEPSSRNPWQFVELNNFNESERWLLCSEGRPYYMNWIRLDPRSSTVKIPTTP